MQIRQQIVNLLWGQLLLIRRHLVPAIENQVPRPLVICWHPADCKVIPMKNSLQARPFPFSGRVRLVAAIAILVVDMPARSLLRIEAKLGIALAALSRATKAPHEQD